MSWLVIAILLLATLAVAGLTWVIATMLSNNAQSATDAYENTLTQHLESMFLFVPAKRLVDLSWLLSAVVFFLVLTPFCLQHTYPWAIPLGMAIAAGLAFAAFFTPRQIVKFLMKRRIEQFDLQLLEALPMMSNALRAGFSINQAFEAVATELGAPMNQEVQLFLQHLRVGVSFSEALQQFEQRVGSPDLSLVCTSIDIARRSGGNLTEIFDSITATIRGRHRIHQHIKTLTAQGRLQGFIIGAMPFLLGGGMLLFKPDYMKDFIFSIPGLLSVLAVIALVTVGGLIIRKIITIDV